jgi:hypothetical protein
MIPNGNEAGYMFINAHNVPLSRLKDDWLRDFSVTDEIIISI